MIRLIKSLPLVPLLLATAWPSAWAQTATTEKVPFVGCDSDGQMDQRAAPADTGRAPLVPEPAASSLAYYVASQGAGVLAPHGWYCFGYYGSSGSDLVLSPDPATGKDLLLNEPAMSGPGIQISFSDSGTSGRFDVARVAARLFPTHRAFAQRVIAEGLLPASNFPFDPYPADALRRYNDNDVGFVTPANKDGMGTAFSKFIKNDDPIMGEAIMVDEGLVLLTVRLPPKLHYLAPVIFNTTRQKYPASSNQ